MKNHNKYVQQHFNIKNPKCNWVKKEKLDNSPIWCSVDLRDGNQSLVVPMTLSQKLEYFKLLVDVGFKEIEIGFPAASETEFLFARKLIEDKLIPSDVTIQVLTQSRSHIIKRTFESLEGAKNAIVHVYNSTSKAQREQVFKKSKKEILNLAVNGASSLVDIAKKTNGNFRFEYSPESFTGTEPDFALDICNRVLDIFKPTNEKKAIINLPATVEHSMPHVFANVIEYMSANLKYRDSVILSLHNHNDRGTAIAATELGLLAGGDRVEGTFFGNGERTGNTDLVTMAMNLYSSGVDPKLDFSNMAHIIELYERTTGLKVHERSPYAGDLVFCAFSGSHQDAIAKGLAARAEAKDKTWTVPYLPIDPKDVGRELETCVIRINSQSGKGGVGYVLEKFGYNLPIKMREAVGYAVKNASDRLNKELNNDEVLFTFNNQFVNYQLPIEYLSCEFSDNGKAGTFVLKHATKMVELKGTGSGRLDTFASCLTKYLNISIDDLQYTQHSLGSDSTAKAISYIGITVSGITHWGAGTDNDITVSSLKALVSCFNKIV